jgi:PAS domain S-box-containing protein
MANKLPPARTRHDGAARDPTPEQALRESEQRFRVMANTVPLLEWIADADGSVTWCNARWYEFTGCSFDELKGWGWLRTHHPDDADRVAGTLRRDFAQGEPWTDHYRLRAHDGAYHWFLARAVPLVHDDGRVTQWFAALTDVTEQREAARERERLLEHERLAHAMAIEAVRSRDQVLSIVSHDLRNPLGTITMSASLLLDLIPDEEARRTERRQLEIIRRAAGTMNRMIEDLLDVTRIESVRLAVERAPTDVASVVDEALAQHRPLAEAARVALECHVPDDLPRMCADPHRLLQILSNLLGNAIKFTPRSGTVTIAVAAEPGGVLWQVSDTGLGIPAEQLPHLFDRFWQARRGDRRGLGLGLAIVEGLIKAHRGGIHVASELGRGTTVSFTIPDISSGCEGARSAVA